MKKIFFLIAVIAFSVSIVFGQTKWQEFSPTDKKFSISMPGKPKFVQEPLSEENKELQFQRHVVNLGWGSFTVAYLELPFIPISPNWIEKGLSEARDRTLRQGDKVTFEQPASIDGFNGREIKINRNDGLIYWGRHYVVRNRFYQVVFIGQNKQANLIQASKFLQSFKPEKQNNSTDALLKSWIEFVSEEQTFSILFPEQPTTTNIDGKDANNFDVKLKTYHAASGNKQYVVIVSDVTLLLKDKQDQVNYLAGAVQGLFRQAKIVKTEEISFNGNYGWDVAALTMNGAARWRAFFTDGNKKCFQIYFLGSKEDALNFETDAFFDSFKLIENKIINN